MGKLAAIIPTRRICSMTLPIRKTLLAAVLGLTLSPMAMALPNVHILATAALSPAPASLPPSPTMRLAR